MSDYKCPVCGETENLTDGGVLVSTNGSETVAGKMCHHCQYFGEAESFKISKPKRNQEAKADAGKIMLELIPPEALEALGRVLTHGAKKYGANKWQDIDDAKNRYKGALLRHYTAYQKNNSGTDADSGLLHIEHVLCNAMFLAVLEERGKK